MHLALRCLRIPTLQGLQRGAPDDRNIVPRELILAQQLPNLQLHQLDQLLVLHHVHLVQKNHDVRYTHLTGQKNVLPGLRHRAIISADHQNRPVHLGRPGNHVLDIVCMPRTVHMGIMPVVRLILHVGRGDGDAALLLLRCLVNLIKRDVVGLPRSDRTRVIAAVRSSCHDQCVQSSLR